ncbi:uncharacterized protein LOC126837806 [Adelges cooleyi]|uniref:uncharacterized protein LOC126837806 n=1 Tax=Adelges cooleyi TaxID=133065 RepID=UPI00217F8840|nr:uncharacterized protein LOC126837806 [Adelges cooleyi]
MRPSPLLDIEYQRVMNSVKLKITNATCLALLTDGWTNVTGGGIISFVITTPEPVFYKSVVPGTNRETTEYIKDQIASVLKEIGPEKLLRICTNNDSAIKGAWVKIKEENEFKHIFAVGCLAHGLNLLLKNLCALPSFDNIISKVRCIVKHVKNTYVVFSTFKDNQFKLYGQSATTLKLPSNTRWAGSVIMMQSLLKNKQSLKETDIAPKLVKVFDKVAQKNLLDEDVFWVNVKRLLSILSPISIGITKSESDKARLSEGHAILSKIVKDIKEGMVTYPLTTTKEEKVNSIIVKRKTFCLYPVHSAANLLDPKYKGIDLNSTEIFDAINTILSINSWLNLDQRPILANLAEYRTCTGLFGLSYIIESAEYCSPDVWWKGLATNEPENYLVCPAHRHLVKEIGRLLVKRTKEVDSESINIDDQIISISSRSETTESDRSDPDANISDDETFSSLINKK